MELTPASVLALSDRLGLGLSADEATVYFEHTRRFLGDAERFVRLRGQGARLQPTTARGRWWRPTPEEDPYAAWIHKCRIEGADAGVLASKTVGFKDHIAVAGVPMTIGSRLLEHMIPETDATVVERVLEHGGTVIGKNVLNGLNSDFGAPINPIAPDRHAGLSSSGSGVAVAAGEVDISFGGDQGGSVRMPAAYCGVIGYKPTFGLISHYGAAFGSDPSTDHLGPIARSVEDIARAVEATAGRDWRDPRQSSEIPDRVHILESLDTPLPAVRIGVLREGFEHAEPATRDAVHRALEQLAADGAEVVEVSAPWYEELHLAQTVLMPEGAAGMHATGFVGAYARTHYPEEVVTATHRVLANRADALSPWQKLSLIVGSMSHQRYEGLVSARAHNLRPSYIAAVDGLLDGLDALAMPTVPGPPPPRPVPSDRLEAVDAGFSYMRSALTRNTFPFNYTGHPAIAMPVPSAEGLPASLQLVGRQLDDARLLRVAHLVESLG